MSIEHKRGLQTIVAWPAFIVMVMWQPILVLTCIVLLAHHFQPQFQYAYFLASIALALYARLLRKRT
jgi:uncharacterized membrane protein YjjB (DUF3815 family)